MMEVYVFTQVGVREQPQLLVLSLRCVWDRQRLLIAAVCLELGLLGILLSVSHLDV